MVIVYCLQALHRSGGIERVVSTKANWLAQHGHKVHIVTTDQRDAPISFPLVEGVQHHDLGLNYELDNDLGRWGRIRALWRKRPLHKQCLEDLLRRVGADITVSTFFQDASFLPSLKDGSKKVLEMHSSKYTPVLKYPPHQRLLRWYGRYMMFNHERIAKRYDQFVILTNEEYPLWKHLGNVTVIPNPKPFLSDVRADMSAQQAIAIGRFEYQKNFAELIDIWAMLPQDLRASWSLHIYGSGPFYQELSQKITDLGLNDTIHLVGDVKDIHKRYPQYSLMCMTSNYEGLPMVLLEGQEFDIPAISYRCPSGPEDILSAGGGLLIPNQDKMAFLQGLMHMMHSVKLRENISTKAKNFAKCYDIELIMPRWIDLFTRLSTRHIEGC